MRQIETFLYSNPKNNQLKISSTEITRQLLDRNCFGDNWKRVWPGWDFSKRSLSNELF